MRVSPYFVSMAFAKSAAIIALFRMSGTILCDGFMLGAALAVQ